MPQHLPDWETTGTVVRREEHAEVASYGASDAQPVDLGMRDTALGTSRQRESIFSNLYPVRRTQIPKFHNAIYLLFGILEGVLGIRFVLGLFGVNPAAGLARFIYGSTAPFVEPFGGLFGQPQLEGIIVEWNALAAILVYPILAGVFVQVVALVMGGPRRAMYSPTSSHDDNA